MPSSHEEREEVASKETRVCFDKQSAGISSGCLASNKRGCWCQLCWTCLLSSGCWQRLVNAGCWLMLLLRLKEKASRAKRGRFGSAGPGVVGVAAGEAPALQSALFHQGSWAEFPQTVEKRKEKFCKCVKHKNWFVFLIFSMVIISNNCIPEYPVGMLILHLGLYEIIDIISELFSSRVSFTCLLLQVAQDCVLLPLAGWNISTSHTDRNLVYASICGYFFFRCFTWHLHRTKPCCTHSKYRVMSLHIIYFGNIQECKEA